eukprot:TRINITY_DN7629_c0_g1_i1.p1 TRINITY_DN7629_c0_g1~~TRINITY_DN7629_c0_g1_i1.p1  ORF type:complete len:324 (-),score=46.91 TRINITY_DN7629_c0_g1_i1:97-1068(-)
MSKTDSLQTLELRGLHLRTDGWVSLSKGLLLNHSLKALKITHTLIPFLQFERLTRAICKSNIIETLDFSANRLDDSYGPLVRKMISSHSERRDEVVWAFGLRGEKPEGISYRKGLYELILVNNKLTDRFMVDICKALTYDSYMLSVDLRGNYFTQEGIEEGLKMLEENKTLVMFDVRENPAYNPEIHSGKIARKLTENINRYKKEPEMYGFIISRKIINNELLDTPFEKEELKPKKEKTRDNSKERRKLITKLPKRDTLATIEKAVQTNTELKEVFGSMDCSTNDPSPVKEADVDVKKKIRSLMNELTELMDSLEKKKSTNTN